MNTLVLSESPAPMPRKKLPIGIQTLREILEEGFYYVDKTGIAIQLIATGKYYFLSRPRRFGKSLFLDTLKELFEGNVALFKGLAAEKQWDWSQKYPVIRISFTGGVLRNRVELDQRIMEMMQDSQQTLGVCCQHKSVSGQFGELIALTHKKTQQRVVVLIDEYDKPILDNIDDRAAATEMREGLKNLYSVLKGADEHLKFVFLTGVSKFSKVSLFSGLNNLEDLTLNASYSAICGYTEHDVDTVFAPELFDLDRDEIRSWYNGYNWLGTPVYNPHDLLFCFDERRCRSFWFESGTPSFLIKLLTERNNFIPNLGTFRADSDLLSTFDVDNIPVEALMFQAGYLTIERQEMQGQDTLYRMGYPNREVIISLHNSLLDTLVQSKRVRIENRTRLYDILDAHNLSAMQELFTAFFDSIPTDWYRNNPIANYEGYYAGVFYSY
jgi:Predicted AAA-ATPase